MRVLDPLYSIYNRHLERKLLAGALPRHVGVILDGNRRFARTMGYDSVSEGHRVGAMKIDELLEWCAEFRIPVVTLWLLSTDNFRRDSLEISNLLAIIEAKIVQLTYAPTTYERRYRIRVFGRHEALPASTRKAIREVEERTSDHDGAMVNLAIGYGGREEIIDAVGQLIRSRSLQGEALDSIVAGLTPAAIEQYLYTANVPDPDLIIRTSGEVRLSGFLLWQSAHSEFYFCDAYWPQFRKVDFLRALRSYQQRKRRFGGDGALEPGVEVVPAGAAVVGDAGTALTRPRLYTTTLSLQTGSAPEFLDITDDVEAVVQRAGIRLGEVRLYARHTSAGLTINEKEPLLQVDMARFMNSLAPPDQAYGHNDFEVRTVNMTEDESPDGHSHCQRLVLNTSESIPIAAGALQLGVWQRVFLVELDRARPREVVVQVFGE
jgi:short-chain Z-isoprenyl diphosphate synthase